MNEYADVDPEIIFGRLYMFVTLSQTHHCEDWEYGKLMLGELELGFWHKHYRHFLVNFWRTIPKLEPFLMSKGAAFKQRLFVVLFPGTPPRANNSTWLEFGYFMDRESLELKAIYNDWLSFSQENTKACTGRNALSGSSGYFSIYVTMRGDLIRLLLDPKKPYNLEIFEKR